ncbi:hypothetical protein FOBRF1_007422 [Fusarium oxysporum]
MPVYSADDLENAIADVKNGVSLKTAAKKNGLPPSTLRGRLTGAQSRQVARQEQLRLTTDQEDDLERWILRQEKLGHAPTHAQVRTIVRSVLARHGDHAPLGRKWTTRFVERHPALKTKLGRRTDWERVNAATPANIKRLFDVYETVDWIPPERRYNADEGGIMEGQGVNGLVIGSSQESHNAVPVKTATVPLSRRKIQPLCADQPASGGLQKGTRRVSALTPSQLARKRANDREAQRAIRARTKAHIERLERELAELKSKQSGDQTVKELLRRNKALEEELIRLKENMGAPITSSPYSVPVLTPPQLFLPDELLLTSTVYDNNLSTGSDAIPSPCGSPFPGDYNSLVDYNQQYVPLPNNCESWASTVPCPIPSNTSSPSSSVNVYRAGYVPTSTPTLILPCNSTGSSSISVMGHKDVTKLGYGGVDHHGTIS